MTKVYFTFLIIVVSLGCSSKKDTPLSKETPINSNIESVLLSGSSEEGKRLFASCAVCHGTSAEGNLKLNAPALANMDSWYVYRQLMNFRKDIRGTSSQDTLGFQMAAMAKTLKDSMSVSHIVAYLKTMPQAMVTSSIKGDVTKGKLTYQTICGSCHGPSAKGNEKLNAPRLNGLEDWYIKRQILNFKNSIRGSHPKDILGAQMIPMMALLPDNKAIDDVVAYMLTTREPDSI